MTRLGRIPLETKDFSVIVYLNAREYGTPRYEPPRYKMARSSLPDSARRSFRVEEVAARNGFSQAFVYEAIKAGRLRARKPGGVGPLRITPESEREWLEGTPSLGGGAPDGRGVAA